MFYMALKVETSLRIRTSSPEDTSPRALGAHKSNRHLEGASTTMVSALSARLMESGSSATSSTKGTVSSQGKGYAADEDQVETRVSTPPFFIDFRTREDESSISQEHKAKKRKLEELSYEASTVKDSISRAGLTFPQMRLSQPSKHLPRINMKGVELITAAKFDEQKVDSVSVVTDYHSAVRMLVREAQAFYALPSLSGRSKLMARAPSNLDDVESSTSSITDSDDGAVNMPNSDACLKPEMEDRWRAKGFMSMGDALSVTKQPRYARQYTISCLNLCQYLTERDFLLLQTDCACFLAVCCRPRQLGVYGLDRPSVGGCSWKATLQASSGSCYLCSVADIL